MMILETKPTDQQLKDRAFWDGIPTDGAEYDGYTYTPRYSVLLDGEPIDLKTEHGKPLNNSLPYDFAVREMQRQSKEHDNITLKMTGYSESLVRRDRLLSA